MSIRPKKALLNPDLQRPSALQAQPRDSNLLWLDKNENIDPLLNAITQKVLDSIPSKALYSYPEAGALYHKLAKWNGLTPESFILTPGSDGVIRLVFEAFVNENDIVLHTYPTFAMYPVYCQMFGASVRVLEYSSKNGLPQLDMDKLLAIIKKERPKLICLPNPDSPTGTVIEIDILSRILAACEETESVLLIDEAYFPFYKETVAPLTTKSKNLIVARTFAKAWGVAGLRIGYAIANTETISFLHKIRPMYETSTLGIEFMTRMMDNVAEMENSVSRIIEGRIYFVHEMKALGFDVIDTEANFVHVRFNDKASEVHNFLADKVLYRKTFDHQSLPGYSRFSVGPKEIMQTIVNWIKQAIK